ncbi:MAG TPA: hypothetical protein DCK83_07185 [Gallionellaceae bacterium]|nr:hypothetical protein [Gallionellaceae bacterium]
MLTQVILSGFLAKRFGKRFELDVASPREAVQALCIQLKGFEQALLEYKPGFRVWLDRELQPNADKLDYPHGGAPIRIVPVIAGSKDAAVNIIVGAVLIWASGGTVGWEWLGNIGYAMVISGVGQLLLGAPKPPDMNASPDNKPNFVYDGAVNTTAQGNSVPICYGEMEIGSQVLSASIYSEQVVSGDAVNDPVHYAL